MPDFAVHYVFGQEVRKALPPGMSEKLREAPYVFGLFGPDPWFMYHLWEHGRGRGRTMHTRKTGPFLTALAVQARKTGNREAAEQLFSYLAGFLCHYALDSGTHPYIIYETTERCRKKKAHQALERALDVLEMKRQGDWGSRHPLTKKYYPRLRLPPEMRADLDEVYARVYGWPRAWRTENRCYALYRQMYRRMEDPRGVVTRLARKENREVLQAFSYAGTYYRNADAENNAHREWRHPYVPHQTSTASFGELREAARMEALRMILAARRFLDDPAVREEELREKIGNRSYLSGLDTEDPANWTVPSLRPAPDGTR